MIKQCSIELVNKQPYIQRTYTESTASTLLKAQWEIQQTVYTNINNIYIYIYVYILRSVRTINCSESL